MSKKIIQILELLRKATAQMPPPMSIVIVERYGQDPFLILISCLLSLRARDTVTLPISLELFSRVRTPAQLLRVPTKQLEELFYSLGFYKRKAQIVKSVSQELIERFGGQVPSTREKLLSIKGVGRKTANLVLGYGFNIPAIVVDTHVHRVSNRLGIVSTKTPDQTEFALEKIVPKNHWIELNELLVAWGQNICVPISPFCSKCVLSPICPKVGVTTRR